MPQIFVSYCHRDKRRLVRLQVHLQPLVRRGDVSPWSDDAIQPGQDRCQQIASALDRADAAVLLVAADFVASAFIADDELPHMLARAESRGLQILWVLVSAAGYERERFARYQDANDPKRPLNTLSNPDRELEWARIAKLISNTLFVAADE